MLDDGNWVTINGRRVFIRNKDINNYMNKKIREKTTKNNNQKKYKIPKENIIKEYNKNYSNFYITSISPDDFVKITSTPEIANEVINEVSNGKYETDAVTEMNKGYAFLDVDMKSGRVKSHEGRHRILGLKNEGYNEVEILIFPYEKNEKDFHEYNYKTLRNQADEQGYSINLKKITPINEEYIKKIGG